MLSRSWLAPSGRTALDLCRGLAVAVLVGRAAFAAPPAEPEVPASSIEERLDRMEREQRQERRELLAQRGARTFERTCAACHGSQGKGDGPGASDLDPRPRDLVAGAFRFRTTESGEPARPEDLERTIRRGLPGSSMPSFQDLLSDAEIAELVSFLRTLSAGGAENPPQAIAIPALPAATPETVREGRVLFTVLECWRCHGTKGDGRGPSARGLVDDQERHVDATDFRYDPLKGGREPADIARAILTGLNGVPMPSYADALVFAREDYAEASTLDEQIPTQTQSLVKEYLSTAPTRESLEALGLEGRTKLRDERLASLVHYLRSLDLRRGFGFWLFRQRPEREARHP